MKTLVYEVESPKALMRAAARSLKEISELELKNVNFRNCSIQENFQDGGALSIMNSRITMTNSIFQKIQSNNGACVYSDSTNT